MFKRIIYAWKHCVILLLITNSTIVFSANEGIHSYQNNLHLSPSRMKKLNEDIHRFRHADNLWDVLRDEFSLHHYETHPAVREKINWFMHNQVYVLRAAARASPYLYYISQQVRKRHLPAEMVLLPIIESGYNPFSISSMGAAGLWQIMPDTATSLGIRQDSLYDGRRDILASTRGALNHLSYLQSFFDGNWLLAIAAYNTGEGNVLAAIKRNIRDGRHTDFWSLPVAQQTRDYVPSLLALAAILSDPERYPLYFPPVRNAPYLAQVDIGKQINLKNAASFAGLSYKKLIQLNPGFNKPSTTSSMPYKLVLPIENVARFAQNFAASKDHVYLSSVIDRQRAKIKQAFQVSANTVKYTLQPGDTVYMIRNDDTLDSIANRFHISKSSLQATNHFMLIPKPGKQIIIPTHLIPLRETKKIANLSSNQRSSDDTIYVVQKGDTIENIARRFGITAAAVRIANLMGKNAVEEGESLIIPARMQG